MKAQTVSSSSHSCHTGLQFCALHIDCNPHSLLSNSTEQDTDTLWLFVLNEDPKSLDLQPSHSQGILHLLDKVCNSVQLTWFLLISRALCADMVAEKPGNVHLEEHKMMVDRMCKIFWLPLPASEQTLFLLLACAICGTGDEYSNALLMLL